MFYGKMIKIIDINKLKTSNLNFIVICFFIIFFALVVSIIWFYEHFTGVFFFSKMEKK